MRPTLFMCAALALASAAFSQPKFTEVAGPAGLAVAHATSPGYPWMHDLMVSGACIGDFNRDGWPDVFILRGGVDPDCLFINNRDGTFTDMADSAKVARKHRGAAAAAADFDGDGWDDIHVTSYGSSDAPAAAGKHKLYRNNRDGTFTDVAISAGVNASGTAITGFTPAWGDYDLDGDLDLFIPTWTGDPKGNRLFRNEGDGTFHDATAETGVEIFAAMGFTPTFADMDGDRWPEILLCADFTTSQYWINLGHGQFINSTEASGIIHDTNAMGSAIADFDADGDLDWYVTNIYDPPPAPDPHGNNLNRNLGNHAYEDVAGQAGAQHGGWGWGTLALDFDHDGHIDILETSGWPFYLNAPARAFRNKGDGTFEDVAADIGFNFFGQGRALLHLDYDLDGDQDILMTVNAGTVRLFRNDIAGPDTHWLRIVLDRGQNPCIAHRGFGTRIIASAAGRTHVRYLDSSTSFLGNNEWVIHLGLGPAATVDELKVLWADGGVTTLHDVPADQHLAIAAHHRADCELDGDRDLFDILCFQQAFASGLDYADFDLDGDRDIDDFLTYLGHFHAAGCP